MRDILTDLRSTLNEVCPTFLYVPSEPPYPYISIEPGQSLQGLPWGPHILIINIKIWSRYKGTREIVRIVKSIDHLLQRYTLKAVKVSLKVTESSLMLLKDEQTRLHTFRLKVRYRGNPHE